MNVDASNSNAANSETANVELDQLVGLFFDEVSNLGSFKEVNRDDVTEPSRMLLAHDHHMTVTLEGHHNCPVNVKVLEMRRDENLYSRKILLTRTTDDKVVQYGIVRLNVDVLAQNVRDEILSEKIPLGRVLINHNVLRQVRLLKIYQIQCGDELANEFDYAPNQTCFGRTAMIYCDGQPAIELLEIVSP